MYKAFECVLQVSHALRYKMYNVINSSSEERYSKTIYIFQFTRRDTVTKTVEIRQENYPLPQVP